MANWARVEREYRNGDMTVAAIAAKHGTSPDSIRRRARAAGWARGSSAMVAPVTRVGHTVDEFGAALGLCRESIYNLLRDPARAPRSIKLGKAHRIIETPAEYAKRIADMQAVA